MRYKHPSTYHLGFSASLQSDDKKIQSTAQLEGEEVVATLKMDGENTSLYPDYIHARSIDSPSNWTRDVAKKIHSQIAHQIPQGWRITCENLYAEHAIRYPDDYLEGYLYMLIAWDEANFCLNWDDTKAFAAELDLPLPKEIYRGPFDEKVLKGLAKNIDTSLEEGFVVRSTKSFHYNDFDQHVVKYVRANHVQPDSKHWLENTRPNGTPKQPCKPAFMSRKKLTV